MSNWEQYKFESRLTDILRKQNYSPNPKHHFGKPVLSAYQLAIEYDKLYHSDVVAMGYSIGGRGTNVRNSLSQYIARELSRKIKNKSIANMEGIFLSNINLAKLVFNYNGSDIVSSSTDSQYDLSLFMMKEEM